MTSQLKMAIKVVEQSEFGALVEVWSEVRFLNSLSNLIDVERKIERVKNGVILQVSFKNKTKKTIKTLSFVVSDFRLPKGIQPKKVLQHGWLQSSEVKFKPLTESTRQKFIFLRRDQNPFSFEEKYGYLTDSVVSEWFSILRFKKQSLVIGAITTADQFSQVFMKGEQGETRIRVTCQLDGLFLKPGKRFTSEKIVFLQGSEEKILKGFANLIAKSMGIKKVKSPIKAMCCSYYWNGNKISEEIINSELDAIESLEERLALDYFQLDAGYTRYFGDWLDYKKRFPNGLEPIVKRINKLGYKAGIWLSPFAVNPNTKVFRKHKGWFLKNEEGRGSFDGRFTSPIDSLIPDLDLEVLDPTSKEFRKYLKEVLTHFKDLGFELYKLDFMYPVCLSTNYSVPMTRAQALRSGVKLIRDIVGDNAHLVSAITQISPIVGLVDSARMGIDTLNPFVCGLPEINTAVNNLMIKKNLRENNARKFFNGVIWTNDPDCLVFREGTGIDNELVEKHKKFAKKNKMSLWIGDSLAKMDKVHKMKVLRFFNDV